MRNKRYWGTLEWMRIVNSKANKSIILIWKTQMLFNTQWKRDKTKTKHRYDV